MTKYFEEIDVNALFGVGVATFRLDPSTSAAFIEIVKRLEWYMPNLPDDVVLPEFCPEKPLARLNEAERLSMKVALDSVLNDQVLTSSLAQYGDLVVNEIEVFNGAIDTSWHHDGLSGKRGHAGNFFLLCYIDVQGQGAWQDEWGGNFEFGARSLGEDWVHKISAPSEVMAIAPNHRTCVLGWNENPIIVHRTAPLRRAVNRVVVAASIRLKRAAAR